MPDAFVSLRAWLRPPSPSPESVVPPEERSADTAELLPVDEPVPEYAEWDDLDDALAAARRFRAALDDALEVSVREMLDAIAREVLGRELQLAPADVRAIVARARERYGPGEPLTIRVHADDAAAFDDAQHVVVDPRMQRGDVVLDVRSGTIDASVAARVEHLLDRYGAM